MKIYLYDGGINRHSGLVVWDFRLSFVRLPPVYQRRGFHSCTRQAKPPGLPVYLYDFAHRFPFQKIKVLSPDYFLDTTFADLIMTGSTGTSWMHFLCPGLDLGDCIDDIHTLYDFAEDGVAGVAGPE